MAKLLKLRRGTTSQHSSFTGAEGEVTVDTDKDTLVVHDGSTAGGHPLAAQDMDNVPAGSILGTQLENSGVSAGTYGSSSAIPIVTVDAQGLVTGASTTAIDSTTIANGTSNVAVANNGDITTTRSGTARHVVNNTGVAVTGALNATGALGCNGALSVVSANPTINLTDTNDNSDFQFNAGNGLFQIRDTTNDAYRLKIASNGQVDIGQALIANSSFTSNGTANFLSSSIYPVTVNSSNNGKIVLQGSADPYIRFRESTSDKAYIQWNQSGYLELYNEEASRSIRLKSGESGLKWNVGGTERTVWHSGNDGTGSGLDADLLDGLQSGSFIRSDASDTINPNYQIRFDCEGTIPTGTAYEASLEVYSSNGDGTDAFMSFHTSSDYAMYFGLDGGTNKLSVGGWSMGSVSYAIAHQGDHFVPAANNTYDLGASNLRFRNVYTNDLNLSNEGSSNDMDGSWGDWTIQEGESDLFLKNNRSGKKYKFNLTEVS